MIRRILLLVNDDVRVVIYPEGGFHVEQWVPGIGWTVDDETELRQETLASARDILAALHKKWSESEVGAA